MVNWKTGNPENQKSGYPVFQLNGRNKYSIELYRISSNTLLQLY
jgi:hypothetical protein